VIAKNPGIAGVFLDHARPEMEHGLDRNGQNAETQRALGLAWHTDEGVARKSEARRGAGLRGAGERDRAIQQGAA